VRPTDDERAEARESELRRRVQERLGPAERFGAGLWVTQQPGQRSSLEILGRAFHPAEHLPIPEKHDWELANRKGAVGGPPESFAGTLDALFSGPRSVLVPPLLVVTDQRLLLLHEPAPVYAPGLGGMRDRARWLTDTVVLDRQPYDRPIPELDVIWQVGRAALRGAEARDNPVESMLALSFTDWSWIVLKSRLHSWVRRFAAVVGPVPR
jgi:hypothetical protein